MLFLHVLCLLMAYPSLEYDNCLVKNQCVEIIHYGHYFCCNGCGAFLVDDVGIISSALVISEFT